MFLPFHWITFQNNYKVLNDRDTHYIDLEDQFPNSFNSDLSYIPIQDIKKIEKALGKIGVDIEDNDAALNELCMSGTIHQFIEFLYSLRKN